MERVKVLELLNKKVAFDAAKKELIRKMDIIAEIAKNEVQQKGMLNNEMNKFDVNF